MLDTRLYLVCRFGYGNGKRIKLTFRINKKAGQHLLESRLSDGQQVKELKDTYEITATVVESDQLEWWLLSQTPSIEVLAPVKLRTKIGESLSTAIKQHKWEK